MKKVLSLVLVLAMVLGTFSFAFAAPLDDVAGTDYEDAVTRLTSLKVLNGYPDGTFKPDNTITRAEFSAAVVKVLGLNTAANAAKGATSFTDVPANHWATGYINIASKMGYVKGMGDGRFAPEAPITYEQAVTLVMRALGYEEAAKARGGYPFGYLVVAAEEGVTDDVEGVQGIPASRGIVALLLDNSIEVPMMIQVGYGSDVKWVKSGTEDTDEKYLLDKLGFDKVSKERVVEFDEEDNEITFEDYGDVEVAEDFDYQAVYGLRLNAWIDGKGKVVLYTVKDDALYDAVDWDDEDEEITLVDADKSYEFSKEAAIYVNGKSTKIKDLKDKYNYAKVVLYDKEIVFFDAYELDDYMVVEKVKGNDIYSYGEDVDAEDFTIVKEGKTINLDNLEEGDILFYNEKADFAEVFNKSETGEIEEVYDKSFDFEDDNYDVAGYYLDGEDLIALDDSALSAMEDEGDVEVFFDRRGNVVFVEGDLGEVETSTVPGLIVDAEVNEGKFGKCSFDVRLYNEDGKKVDYEFGETIVEDSGYEFNTASKELNKVDKDEKVTDSNVLAAGWFAKNRVIQLEVDEDGDVETFAVVDVKQDVDDLKFDAKYAGNKKLQDSTKVFFKTNADKIKTFEWKDAKDYFDEADDVDVFYNDKGYAKYLYIEEGSTSGGETELTLAFVKSAKKLSGKKEYRTVFVIDDEEYTFDLKKDLRDNLRTVMLVAVNDAKDYIKEVDSFKVPGTSYVIEGKVKDRDLRADEIKVDKTTVELEKDAYIYDVKAKKARDLRDVKVGDEVAVYVVKDTEFAKFVLINPAETTKVGDIDFTIDADNSNAEVELTTIGYGRTVTATVYADIDWASNIAPDNYEVDVTEELLNISGKVGVRKATGTYNASNDTITLSIVADEDVYVGDSLVIDAKAITVEAKKGDEVEQTAVLKTKVELTIEEKK